MRAERTDVLFVLPPRALLLDLAGPAEALRLANQHSARAGDKARFRLRYTGPATPAESSVGLALAGLEALPDALEAPTWLVLVGQPARHSLGPTRPHWPPLTGSAGRWRPHSPTTRPATAW